MLDRKWLDERLFFLNGREEWVYKLEEGNSWKGGC